MRSRQRSNGCFNFTAALFAATTSSCSDGKLSFGAPPKGTNGARRARVTTAGVLAILHSGPPIRTASAGVLAARPALSGYLYGANARGGVLLADSAMRQSARRVKPG